MRLGNRGSPPLYRTSLGNVLNAYTPHAADVSAEHHNISVRWFETGRRWLVSCANPGPCKLGENMKQKVWTGTWRRVAGSSVPGELSLTTTSRRSCTYVRFVRSRRCSPPLATTRYATDRSLPSNRPPSATLRALLSCRARTTLGGALSCPLPGLATSPADRTSETAADGSIHVTSRRPRKRRANLTPYRLATTRPRLHLESRYRLTTNFFSYR